MGKEIDIKKHLTDGFEMFKAHTNTLVVLTIGYIVLSLAINIIPFGGLVVGGPLMGAIFIAIIEINSGEGFDIKRVAEGVMAKIVPLILLGIVSSIFIIIGTFLLIIPGILVFGWYMFAYLYVLDRDMDFWPAMEASRQFAFSNQVGVFLFALAIVGVNLLGVLAFGIGILVSIPVTLCAVFKAYSDLIGVVDDPKNRVGSGGKVMASKPAMKVTPPPPPAPKGQTPPAPGKK